MHPILFTIPVPDFLSESGLPIRAFGAMVAIGFLVGSHLLGKLAARYGDDPEGDPDRYAKITIWILVGVILGARLMYVGVEVGQELVAETPDPQSVGRSFLDEPLRMLAFWEGGLVMYGGFIGAVLLGMWSARREGVRPIHAFDLGVVAGFVGLAIGRVGCYLVGDDFGAIVPEAYASLPWPITLTVPDPLPEQSLFGEENRGQVLWATQNWMTINALILAAFAFWRLKHRRYTGQVCLWVVLLYAITRSVIESFRGDSVRGLWFGGAISTSQLVSLVAGAGALFFLIRFRGRRDAAPAGGAAA